MNKLKKKICIFDINNSQEDYARCLEFIKTIESKELFFDDKSERISKLSKKMKISVGDMNKGGAYLYIEKPMSVTNTMQEPESIYHRCINEMRDVFDILEEDIERHYHLRVHFSNRLSVQNNAENEFVQLQYLALLLRYFEDYDFIKGKIKRDITVFFVPSTGEEYPFLNQNNEIDTDTYALASQYLRLLTKKYNGVIYGAIKEKGEVTVTALEFRRGNRYETYFPLMLIDEKRYEKLFSEIITEKEIDVIFSMNERSRYGDSRDENPDIAIRDIAIETAIKRILVEIREKTQNTKKYKEKMKFLQDVVVKQRNISVMQFCLFAFMLSCEEYADIKKYVGMVQYTWKLATEVSDGLKQIVQNSVQHSMMKGCMFSFCLHKSRLGESLTDFAARFQKEYPNTEFFRNENTGKIEALEVFVSDLNDKEDMIENFCKNLKEEQCTYEAETNGTDNLIGHCLLNEKRENLAVRNLFSEYREGDEIEAWRAFRSHDMIAHIGLSLFKLTAKRCRASVKAISNKTCHLTDSRKMFYMSNDAYGIEEVTQCERFVVPGTQFSIMIPIHEMKLEREKGLGQLQRRRNVVENYKTFAKFVGYEELPIWLTDDVGMGENEVGSIINLPLQITKAKDKYKLVAKWTEFWKNRIAYKREHENVVHCHEFGILNQAEYFRNSDNIEVCLKGLIEALDIVKQYKKDIYIAFLHLPDGFIEEFKQISVLFGVREFPQNLQIFLCENNINNRMVFVGENFKEAIYNSYILSLEQATNGFSKEECKQAEKLNKELECKTEEDAITEIGIFPFDAIIKYSKEEKMTIFEAGIKEVAEQPLDSDSIGYKLENTHMRLGSKVHIRSFYEMSFLFYRTTIANRIAFIILQKLKNDIDKGDLKGFDLKKDVVIFFGYASYSKAILTSISEILRFYRDEKYGKKDCEKIAFASYQHNLQTESETIQMYFTIPKDFPGQINVKNQLELDETVEKMHVIQLVPISSTLTTFDKMWNKFYGSIHENSIDKIKMTENYTVFWVVSEKGNMQLGLPSTIEKRYWEKASENRVQTKFNTLISAGRPEVGFFIRNAVMWEDPLDCDLCYPDYVLEEVPLVETDPTSTVPAQQIRFQKKGNIEMINQQENNKRLLLLKDCVYYGHIYRRQNHYQYYIDTQKFFNTVKEDVRYWLEEQSGSTLNNVQEPILNIIFSPEHNTNVGFAQYVNTYYFGGLAEIVSLNVDKEFRSNFICEHAALVKMIEKLYYDNVENEMDFVRFYFVDDTIISGETFEKANSFLHSLIPDEIKENCPANLFRKVFLLIDRMSNETKRMYVEKADENFLSFVHIDVSNLRTHGDSCIGCKLEQNAERLRKRSATRSHSIYWTEKSKTYQKIAYDDRKKMDAIDKENAFHRLLVSHVLQNIIIKKGNTVCVGETYDVLLDICEWFLKVNNNTFDGFDILLKEVRGIEGIKILIKTICRPFFSFDSKIRMQVLTLLVTMAERLMSGIEIEIPLKKENDTSKKFLYEKDRIHRTKELVRKMRESLGEENLIDFLMTYLMEGLTDMGSTYLMRLHTIRLAYQYIDQEIKSVDIIKKFWESYTINLQRLLDNNSDETKELWLEYLYVNGMEYHSDMDVEEGGKITARGLYKAVVGSEYTSSKNKNCKNEIFSWFCNEIFLQNTGIYFDGLKKLSDKKDAMQDNDVYFMEYWKRMRYLSEFKKIDSNTGMLPIELDFYNKIVKNDTTEEENDTSINEWYKEFLEHIYTLIKDRYPVVKEEMNIALVTENIDKNEFTERIQGLDIVKEKINCREKSFSEIRYEIKRRIMEALENTRFNQQLVTNGYFISDSSENSLEQGVYFIIYFDNPNSGKNLSNIEGVFLYLDIKSEDTDLNISDMAYFILRDILTYRNKILEVLERDFSGEIFAKYAHTVGEKNIMSHEKATSHNTTADDEITVELFVRPELAEQYDALEELDIAKWLLLRNYTNGQIAKIFNRSFRESDVEDEDGKEIPPLYVNSSGEGDDFELFKQKLETFGDLEIKDGDNRFALLRQIMDFECEVPTDAELIQNSDGYSFNLEYFKCIILDICFSGIKYMSDGEDYLIRVDQFLSRIKKSELYRERADRIECKMHIYREVTDPGKPDYLVFRNPVDKTYHELVNWKKQNETIKKRLSDPLDFADGHMSLYAINRYIENFDKSLGLKCQFRYDEPKTDFHEKARLYFETKLPVLKEK